MRRDYEAEYRAEREREEKQRWYYTTNDSWSPTRYEDEKREREDALYDYAGWHWEVSIEKNDWTDEVCLYSEQTWYELNVKVKYMVEDKFFEKIIEIESDSRELDCVYIECNQENPDEVYQISKFLNTDTSLMDMFIIAICIVPAILYLFYLAYK
ncbi:MAG: hypothetical protein IKJ01_00500 [Lachnospiraceae bacterium]|nr:hypothetical protein [Lachnospiraceae bacterium]